MNNTESNRVIVYVDGFNLYFGMLDAGIVECKWLNIMALAKASLKQGQILKDVKFFTSNISNNAAKEKRQRTYLDALVSTGVKIIRGKYERKEVLCENCSHTWLRTNEKMTDVNIATSLIMDAVKDEYDVAILISGDSDLVPAIRIVNETLSPKFVTVIFPPARQNVSVKEAAKGSYPLGRKRLKDCQFENEVITTDGYKLNKPTDLV